MKVVANQRIIHYGDYDYKILPFHRINELEPMELKLYCYLFSFKNINNNFDTFVLYSSTFTNTVGVSIDSYRKAFNGLVKKGYLVEESKNNYLFCPDKYNMSDSEVLSIIKEYIINKYSPNSTSNKSYYDYSLDYHEDESCLDIFPEVEEESYDGFYHIPDECISKDENVPF